MRIGVVAPPWLCVPPVGYGGTESVVDVLASGYAARGHEVVLAATGDSTCPVPTVYVYEHALGFPTGATPFEARHVLAAYDALSTCDLIDDHTVLGPIIAGPEPHPPIVWTNHGPFDDELGAIFAKGAGQATVVAVSRSQAATAGAIEVATVIHHGLDIRKHREGAGDGGYLVSLGRMAPSKGIAQAVDIARASGMPLVIAAKMTEPAEQAYFDAEVRPRLGRGIEFVGEVGSEEKVALLGGAVALLNPITWDEPFGLVMIESLASGTPVISMGRGAAREIVDDGITGFLRRDAAEMAEAVPHVGELSREACRAAVVHRFSTDRMVDAYLDLFTCILEGPNPRRAVGTVRTRFAASAEVAHNTAPSTTVAGGGDAVAV